MNEIEKYKPRFNSQSKTVPLHESKSTSLSSSSDSSSHNRFNTDTKFPGDILRSKKKRSLREKATRDRINDNQFLAVAEEEEQDKHDNSDHQKKLRHFTIMNDRREFNGEFNEGVNKMSEKRMNYQLSRCKSVGTIRLARVVEQKKEQQENKKLFSKLNSLMDKNEFNVRKSFSNLAHLSSTENLESYNKNFGEGEIIAQIGEVQENKEAKNILVQKSIIESELDKIIVDEIDDKKKYREEREEPEIQSILEQRNDDDCVDEQLRSVLHKLQQEKEFIKKMIKSENIKDDILPLENENITLLTECIKEENEAENCVDE